MAAKTVLNIEVGDRLTKVCHSAKKGKRRQILNSFLFPTPDQTVSDGLIVDPKTLADALREQLALHHASSARNVTFTLSTSKVASREVLLPPIKEQRLKEAVETNAKDYFPVDMSNYQVAFNLLEHVTSPEPACRVLVMAAPKPLLVGYSRLAEQASLVLDAIDYSGNSQYQVLRSMPGDKLTMYVDVNVGSTTVSFMRGPTLLLQRMFNFGGDELITAARTASGGDGSYLEALELACDETRLAGVLSDEDRDDAISRLVTGIARSADFFSSSHSSDTVEQVVLMGACCRLSGLRGLVAHTLDRDTVLLSEVSDVDFVSNSAEGVSTYISCIGSLVRPLDFIPDEMRKRGHAARAGKREKADSITFGLVVCILCVVAGLAVSAVSIFRYMEAADREAALQARIEELAYVAETHDTYLTYQTMAGNLAFVGSYAETPNAELTAFFEEMERKMPSSLLLLSAVCTPEGITMNLTTPGMEEAAVVIDQLRGFESIASLTVSTITESTDETGYITASFSVSCAYTAQEAPVAPAAALTQ
ncbi:MAG: pilus assembly protein PilM [Clostridiales bacterium]|nr:pilus assembly protein PilM [Clostridiales bacterium]